MRNLEVLVVIPFQKTPKVLNWKVTTTNNVDAAIEKIQTSAFKVLAIHNSIDELEKIRGKKLAYLLDSDLVVVEFENANELDRKVNETYWKSKKYSSNLVYHDNSFGLELNDLIQFK